MTQSSNDIPFNDLVFRALDHALDSLSHGEELVPFVMTETALERIVASDATQADREARILLSSRGRLKPAALAYAGSVSIGGAEQEAIIIEATEPSGRMLSLAQRIIRVDGQIESIGNPVLVYDRRN